MTRADRLRDLVARARALAAGLLAWARALFVRGAADLAHLNAGGDAGMLAAIERAIASGVNTVEHAGQVIVFSCTRELLAERDRLARLLNKTGN